MSCRAAAAGILIISVIPVPIHMKQKLSQSSISFRWILDIVKMIHLNLEKPHFGVSQNIRCFPNEPEWSNIFNFAEKLSLGFHPKHHRTWQKVYGNMQYTIWMMMINVRRLLWEIECLKWNEEHWQISKLIFIRFLIYKSWAKTKQMFFSIVTTFGYLNDKKIRHYCTLREKTFKFVTNVVSCEQAFE